MVIALHASIHDCLISLYLDSLLRYRLVHPVRVAPHTGIDLAELGLGACVVGYRVFEGLFEFSVIEENVGIVEPSVEVSFNGFDRLYDPVKLLIARQNDKSGVRSRFFHLLFRPSAS